MVEVKDKILYASVKKLADIKFQTKTGIYKSSWIVREYKKLGGEYIGKKPENYGISRWFKEKWVNLNKKTKVGYEECGRKNKDDKYPLCRPTIRVTKDTPKTLKELPKHVIDTAKKMKKDSKYIKF